MYRKHISKKKLKTNGAGIQSYACAFLKRKFQNNSKKNGTGIQSYGMGKAGGALLIFLWLAILVIYY